MATNSVASPNEVDSSKMFQRFSLVFRIQHVVLLTSCMILMITGIPLKFASAHWASAFLHLLGGVRISGIIHRVGAVGLIGVGVYHMFYVTFSKDGRHNFWELFPRIKDVTDVCHNVWYFFGFSKTPPKFRRFSYIEKFDYWAVYWGTVIMIISGLMLWFANKTMAILPKYAIDIAHEAHSDEGLLCALAIIIWHFYNVHLNPDKFPMSWTWLTGKISKEDMIRHHPLEYEEIIAKQAKAIDSEDKQPVKAAKK